MNTKALKSKNKQIKNLISPIDDWDKWPVLDFAIEELSNFELQEISHLIIFLEDQLKHIQRATSEVKNIPLSSKNFPPDTVLLIHNYKPLKELMKEFMSPPPTIKEVFAIHTFSKFINNEPIQAFQSAIFLFTPEQLSTEEHKTLLDIGIKSSEGLKKAREASAKVRAKKSYNNKKEWRTIAVEEWPKNPGWTINNMAKWIQDKTKTNRTIGTIENEIKGIKTTLFKKNTS